MQYRNPCTDTFWPIHQASNVKELYEDMNKDAAPEIDERFGMRTDLDYLNSIGKLVRKWANLEL